ncbi:hypothetical protein PENARI_c077G07662 [Penicillium arizonense]|uniref:Uncharacterized protein n=1 Tax=Penicillium arizonense TaxID=1835702 RepID=A0A1F5L1C7_PENAI|nr:hypothetical protein PENARI_c077G07662 [Penicillium arizonense]OGE47004.1 hypothetical protein PENARI_c077G07662 [Penicillium arizonense]
MLCLSLLAFWATNSYGVAIVIPAFNSSTTATRTVSVPSTITTGPATTNPVAINTCSYYNKTESRTLWDNPWCSMYAGTVDLVYWPTNDNYSYPSTFYDDKIDYTYSSPSVYMVVNTLYGWNPCGLLGPSTSREVFAFDLTEVSTLVPYTQSTATTRRGTRQLYLSDLGTHCTGSYNQTELATQLHPMKDDDTRCNPFLVVPAAVKRYGHPYWLHCNVANNKFAAHSASTKATAPSGPENTEPAATTTDLDNTGSSDATPQKTDSATADPESTIANDASTSAGGDTVVAKPGNTETAAANPSDFTDAPVDDGNPQPAAATNIAHETVTGVEAQFDTAAYSDGVVSTASEQVVSLGADGLKVVDPDTGKSSTYGSTVPTTKVVYGGQTLTLGGPAVTVTNVVVVSPGPANLASATDAAGSGPNTPIATPSTVPDSSANRIYGGVVGLLLALMTSIWV